MEGLDLNSILDDEDTNSLFGEEETEETEETSEDTEDTEETEDNKEKNNTAEVDPDNMFEETSESVGSEENKDSEEDTTPTKESTSPDFFSSIAKAFAEEGIFPDLEEEDISNIKSAQDLRDAIDAQIQAGLNDTQRRIAEALNNNVEPSQIRQYEGVIQYLDSLDEETLSAESEEGEELRKKILYQDYINRGFSQARAEKAVNRALENGTDIEDAKEALESTKAYFEDEYNQLLNSAKEEREREEAENEERVVRLRDSIFNDKLKLFEGVDIDKSTRQRAFDAICKPVYKDSKTGATYTAVQKLQLEDTEEYLAKLGIIYAVTDGFKSLDKLVKTKAKKEIKKGFSELEKVLNTTRRTPSGSLDFVSGTSGSDTMFKKGMILDF